MHEQSETIQTPDGKWVNVYGRNLPNSGQQLPGTPTYGSLNEAVTAAKERSEAAGSHGPRPEDFGAVPVGPDPRQFGAVPVTELPGISAEDQTTPSSQGMATNAAAGLNQGVASTFDQVLNAPVRIANLGIVRAGGEPLSDPNYLQRGLEALAPAGPMPEGLPGVARRVGQFAGAGAVPMGRLGSIAQEVKNILFGGASGLGAESGEGIAKAFGAGQSGQAVAGMAGSMAVPAAGLAAEAGIKAAARGGATPAEIAANAQTIKDVGVQPTMATVTGSPSARAVEYSLAKTPIAGTPVLETAEKNLEAIRSNIANASRTLASVRDAPTVGANIQSDMKQFMKDSSTEFRQLDEAFQSMVPTDARFGVDNTLKTLGRLSKVSPELPEFHASLKDSNIKGWYDKLKSDTAGVPESMASTGILNQGGQEITRTVPGKPFEGVSIKTMLDVRSEIGDFMDRQAAGITGDKGQGQYKALYEAISKDIEGALKGTKAEPLMAQRDNFWKAYRNKVDNFIGRIAGQPDSTRAYVDTLSQANISPRQIAEVRSSVTPETWKQVAAAKLAKMGGADIEGATFDMQKWSKEWKAMNERPTGSNAVTSADALFGGMGNTKQNLDKISAAVDLMSKGGPQYRKAGGASPVVGAAAGGAAGMTVFDMLLRGHPGLAAAAGGAAAATTGAGRLVANLMTSPAGIEWLTRSMEIPAERAQEWLKRMPQAVNPMIDAQDRNQRRAQQRGAPQGSTMQGVRG